MPKSFVSHSIELPGGGVLRLLQPQESAELPDTHAVESAPIAPYWSVLWRSGLALARDSTASRFAAGAWSSSAAGSPCRASPRHARGPRCSPRTHAPRRSRSSRATLSPNDVAIETATVDWVEPDELVSRAPFDLVLAADVLYQPASVAPLLSLLPRLAPEAWLADPGRPAAGAFFEQAGRRWPVETRVREVVRIHRLQLA